MRAVPFSGAGSDGTEARYRRDAQVQTVLAATAEERRLLAKIGHGQYGDVHEPRPEARAS
jgi:hypothetical protein